MKPLKHDVSKFLSVVRALEQVLKVALEVDDLRIIVDINELIDPEADDDETSLQSPATGAINRAS